MSLSKKIRDEYTSKFVKRVLKEDAELIASEQEKVVRKNRLFETGLLARSFKGNFSIRADGVGQNLTMNYIAYTRFLDIKDVRRKQKSYLIYNKILFGILYNSTVRKLAFGFTEKVIDEIKKLDNKTIDING